MSTTFERVAKILENETEPANWIESAFAGIANSVLPAVTSTDNGKILSVDNGKWAAKTPFGLPYVTPEMFSSIADMYTYAKTNGKPVFISEDITSDSEIVIKADTFGFDGSKITAPGFSIDTACTLEGISFVCSASPSGDDEDILLGIYTHDCTVTNCSFAFSTDNGKALAIKGSSARITIENCEFNKCSTNFTGCDFVTVRNCVFNMGYVNTGHECIQFTAKTPGIIDGNQFYNSENDFIDLYSAGSDCVITGNTFDGCHSHNGIELKTTIKATGGSSDDLGWCRRNIISGNHFKNLVAGSGGIYAFISIVAVKDADIEDSVTYYPGETIVENNIFEKCSTEVASGVYFFAVNVCARNVIVKNNIADISENTSSGRTACIYIGENAADQSAAFWKSSQNIIVDSNILGGNSYGVSVGSAKGIKISNNKGLSGHALKRFISLAGTISDIKVIANECDIGTYVSFAFLHCGAALTDFDFSRNSTDSSMAITTTVVRGKISDNIFSRVGVGLDTPGMNSTSLLISNNIFNSTSWAIFAQNNTFSNTAIIGNSAPAGKIIRSLTATSGAPVMLANVINNAENNDIRTT